MKAQPKYDLLIVLGDENEDFFQDPSITESFGDNLRFVAPSIFSNGETNVEINLTETEKRVLLISRTSGNPNNFIMNMMFAIDCLKKQGAEVDLFIPCFPYARQDRKNGRNVSITSSVVLRMFESAGIGRLYVVDIHASQMEGYAKFPIENLDSLPVLMGAVRSYIALNMDCEIGAKGYVVVSPDAGGVKRAKKYADALGAPLAIIHKTRDPLTNESVSHNIVGDVFEQRCIVVDDMVDSGNTLLDANDLLMKSGAKSVLFVIAHPVLSKINPKLSELSLITLNTCTNVLPAIKVFPIERHFLQSVLGKSLFKYNDNF
jgi:ribose-phosphate pyrophosphokinase